MMRSLWSAASGMVAQQTNVDTIANNISNINTTGFKADRAEFKTLLYQTLQSTSTGANGNTRSVSSQVGMGVRLAAITTSFEQGPLVASSSKTAVAINGNGFFAVQGNNGNTYYTRNGDFKVSMGPDGPMLATSDGYPVLDRAGNPIVFPPNANVAELMIGFNGEIGFHAPDGTYVDLGVALGVFQFNNPAGLESIASGLYIQTPASGAAMNEWDNPNLAASEVRQGFLEGSNVNIADEMINLIVAQRAYEMTSRAIQASDDMLAQANQLKR